MSITKPADQRITRCAIYTRKSTEHGLDMAVNSLEAQRDVCRAYVKCQAHRVEELAKSALKALLVDRAKLIGVVLSLGLYSHEIGRLLRNG